MRADFTPALMIWSIRLSLASGQTVFAVSTLEHPHPCSGLAGLQEEFLTAVADCLTIRQAVPSSHAAGITISSFTEYNASRGISRDDKDAEK